VPYRGLGSAMQDLIAGQIDTVLADAATSLPQVRAGTIKAYAVASKTRLAAAPNIPTVDEAGLPGFYASLWFGLWAPARTPQDVIAKLNSAVVEGLADPTVRQKAEIDKWWPIIKAAGIKME
jgi:tripartite-type tricarboxylate transporter receptor subunit TctC